jgi:hypothetical protein
MPIIRTDTELDQALAKLAESRSTARQTANAAVGPQATMRAKIETLSAQLAELRAGTEATIAEVDARSRAITAGVVRYLKSNWMRLKTSSTRVVRASGVKITQRDGVLSFETDDEEAAVAELRAAGLIQFVRLKPTINKPALGDCARATEDGEGIVITLGEGENAREITIKTIRRVRGATAWEIELPGHEKPFKVTEEDLAQLLAGLGINRFDNRVSGGWTSRPPDPYPFQGGKNKLLSHGSPARTGN